MTTKRGVAVPRTVELGDAVELKNLSDVISWASDDEGVPTTRAPSEHNRAAPSTENPSTAYPRDTSHCSPASPYRSRLISSTTTKGPANAFESTLLETYIGLLHTSNSWQALEARLWVEQLRRNGAYTASLDVFKCEKIRRREIRGACEKRRGYQVRRTSESVLRARIERVLLEIEGVKRVVARLMEDVDGLMKMEVGGSWDTEGGESEGGRVILGTPRGSLIIESRLSRSYGWCRAANERKVKYEEGEM